jgi:hypothetical protein
MSECIDAAVKKLADEKEKSKQNKNAYMAESIADVIIETCQSDEAFARLALQKQKTLDKCIAYITQKAQEHIPKDHGNIACVPMPADTVYGWVREYYNLDDAAIEAEKKRKQAEADKRAAEDRAKAEERRKKVEAEKEKTEAEKKAEKVAAKEAQKQDAGQISFF